MIDCRKNIKKCSQKLKYVILGHSWKKWPQKSVGEIDWKQKPQPFGGRINEKYILRLI